MYRFLVSFIAKYDKSKGSGQLISLTSSVLDSGLDKKSTLVRGVIRGFRSEYTGRSVIVGDPFLSLNEFGLPYAMGLTFFEANLVYQLRTKGDFGLKNRSEQDLRKLLSYLRGHNLQSVAVEFVKGKTTYKEKYFEACAIDDYIFDLTFKQAKDHYLVLNREPSLHRFNVRASKPVLVRDLAIHLHPMHCKGYNGDFDGDTMSVSLPVTKRAQEDVYKNMSVRNNIINHKDNSMIISHAQDIVLGLYYLTMLEDNREDFKDFKAFKAFKAEQTVRKVYTEIVSLERELTMGLIKNTDFVVFRKKGLSYFSTAGRILFNSMFAGDYGFTNEEEEGIVGVCKLKHDYQLTKSKIDAINLDYYKEFDSDEFIAFMDRVKDLGFLWSDLSGLSLSFEDFVDRHDLVKGIVAEVEQRVNELQHYVDMQLITDESRAYTVVQIWRKAIDEVNKLVTSSLERNNYLFMLIDSKSRGDFSNYAQCVGMGGQVSTVGGEMLEMPIKNSYIRGLNIYEYFLASFFARKALISSSILTEKAGELTKNLITLCQDVVVEEADCGASPFIMQIRYDSLSDSTIEEINGAMTKQGIWSVTDCDEKLLVGKYFSPNVFKALAVSKAKWVMIGTTQIPLRKVMCKSQKNWLVGKVYVNSGNAQEEQANLLGIKNGFITEKFVTGLEDTCADKVSFRSMLNCKVQHGVCQKCYGSYLGNTEYPPVGEHIGIISAQAIGEPSTQLTLNTTHGKASDEGIVGGVEKLLSYVEGSFNNSSSYDEPCLYAWNDTLYDASFVETFRKTDVLSQLIVRNVRFERVGDINGVILPSIVKPLDSIVRKFDNLSRGFNYQDLLLFNYDSGRVRLVNDYFNIFASKDVKVNARNFELVVRQQTRHLLAHSTVKNIPESSVVSRDKLEELGLVEDFEKMFWSNYQGASAKIELGLVFTPLWLSYKNAAKYAGNGIVYVTSNRLKSSLVNAVVNGLEDDGKSVISAQTVGADLVEGTVKQFTEIKYHKPRVLRENDSYIVDEIRAKAYSKKNDLFGGELQLIDLAKENEEEDLVSIEGLGLSEESFATEKDEFEETVDFERVEEEELEEIRKLEEDFELSEVTFNKVG
jgi:hypothetical protein